MNVPARDTSHWHGPEAWERVDFPQVPDNVKHDTLAVQITFDLKDGTHLMVAANAEETREGLALYHYRAKPDSSAEIFSRSSPGYESWTMYPTFFAARDKSRPLIMLVNTGEKQSWGQKVMLLDSAGFVDIGFLDAALPIRVVEPDSQYLKRGSIAPFVRCPEEGAFEFASDSIYIYDDGAGGSDYILPAADVRLALDSGKFTFHVNSSHIRGAKPDGPAL